MKLLAYTSRIQLYLFIALFGLFAVVFYFILRWNVLQNVDEVLSNRKIHLLAYFEKNPNILLTNEHPLDDFSLFRIDSLIFHRSETRYSDTLIYETVDDEFDEYRKLTTFAELHGNYYRLDILKPHIEADEIISSITITLGGLFIGLILSFYFSQRIISRKIWEPFYELLAGLRNYQIDKETVPELPETKIFEFDMLKNAITELSGKNKEVFESQKNFIGNVSHELQTPLSIIQSKLEILIGQSQLTAEQAVILEGIIASTQRLKKLNKTLLLLSKIENRQFLLNDDVNIAEIIENSMEYYEEQKKALSLNVEADIYDKPELRGNKLLTEILIQNLLKNAFLHNINEGSIKVVLKKDKLTLSNTGNANPTDPQKIFVRFYKNSSNPDTWGLGLAIAHKIAEVSGWKLVYSQNNAIHNLELYFQ